jgi:hypothetical protein
MERFLMFGIGSLFGAGNHQRIAGESISCFAGIAIS